MMTSEKTTITAAATTTSIVSPAEEMVRKMSRTIGMVVVDDDHESNDGSVSSIDEAVAQRLDVICANMKQEFVFHTWQLKTLDSHEWEKLGAPIGLAAAIRHVSLIENEKEVEDQKSTTMPRNTKSSHLLLQVPEGKRRTTTSAIPSKRNRTTIGRNNNNNHSASSNNNKIVDESICSLPSFVSSNRGIEELVFEGASSSSSNRISTLRTSSAISSEQKQQGGGSGRYSSSRRPRRQRDSPGICQPPPSFTGRNNENGMMMTSILETSGDGTKILLEEEDENNGADEEEEQEIQFYTTIQNDRNDTTTIDDDDDDDTGKKKKQQSPTQQQNNAVTTAKKATTTTTIAGSGWWSCCCCSCLNGIVDMFSLFPVFHLLFHWTTFPLSGRFRRAIVHSKSGLEMKSHSIFTMEMNILASALILGAAVELWGLFPSDNVILPGDDEVDTTETPGVPAVLANVYHFMSCLSIIIQVMCTSGWIWTLYAVAAVAPSKFKRFLLQIDTPFSILMHVTEFGQNIFVVNVSLILTATILSTTTNLLLRKLGFIIPMALVMMACRFLNFLCTYIGRVAYHGMFLVDDDDDEELELELEFELEHDGNNKLPKQGSAIEDEMLLRRQFLKHVIVPEEEALDMYHHKVMEHALLLRNSYSNGEGILEPRQRESEASIGLRSGVFVEEMAAI